MRTAVNDFWARGPTKNMKWGKYVFARGVCVILLDSQYVVERKFFLTSNEIRFQTFFCNICTRVTKRIQKHFWKFLWNMFEALKLCLQGLHDSFFCCLQLPWTCFSKDLNRLKKSKLFTTAIWPSTPHSSRRRWNLVGEGIHTHDHTWKIFWFNVFWWIPYWPHFYFVLYLLLKYLNLMVQVIFFFPSISTPFKNSIIIIF